MSVRLLFEGLFSVSFLEICETNLDIIEFTGNFLASVIGSTHIFLFGLNKPDSPLITTTKKPDSGATTDRNVLSESL